VVSFTLLLLYPLEKSPRYPLDRRLVGIHELECRKIKSRAVKTQLYELAFFFAVPGIHFL
jgi:hypothetical protein